MNARIACEMSTTKEGSVSRFIYRQFMRNADKDLMIEDSNFKRGMSSLEWTRAKKEDRHESGLSEI